MANLDLNAALQMVPQGAETVFPKSEYDRRLAALRAQMVTKGFELFLTSGPENIFYLTGQQTPGYYTFNASAWRRPGSRFTSCAALRR
jgi:Xaa-Pro dipeptidase